MVTNPRHDIREHVNAIVTLASQADPKGFDSAIHDIPSPWDVTSIVSQRHGYGYICTLEVGVVGYQPVCGLGRDIPKAIRAACEVLVRTYPDHAEHPSLLAKQKASDAFVGDTSLAAER